MEQFNITDYTDCYFTKSRDAAKYGNHDPVVVWQVFQKHDAIFCGVEFIKEFFDHAIEVHSLKDGDSISPFEPAMIIKAHAQAFVEYETVMLGTLARCTRIATNVRHAVDAANGKPVLFFPARFDVKETQLYDGYAAAVGGAAGCATPMQTHGYNLWLANKAIKTDLGYSKLAEPVGTMPHALIAIYNRDTVQAALALADSRPDEMVFPLVDFTNNCARTAVEVFKAFKERGIAHRLAGVRLDTSEKLVDAGIADVPDFGSFGPEVLKGVNPVLVRHVRRALDANGATNVKIAVSGGFTPEKIAMFEADKVPADIYAIGEGFLKGSNAFTSDIVARMEGNQLILGQGKVGRELKTTTRLTIMKGDTVPA